MEHLQIILYNKQMQKVKIILIAGRCEDRGLFAVFPGQACRLIRSAQAIIPQSDCLQFVCNSIFSFSFSYVIL